MWHTQCKSHSYMALILFSSQIQHQTINGITHPKPFIFQYFIHFVRALTNACTFSSPSLPFRFVSCNRLCAFYACVVLQFIFCLCVGFFVPFHELAAAHISIFHIILHNMCVVFIADYSSFFITDEKIATNETFHLLLYEIVERWMADVRNQTNICRTNERNEFIRNGAKNGTEESLSFTFVP